MAENLTTIDEPIFEKTTRFITATIKDQDETGFKPSTLTLLLYNKSDGSVINSRNRVSVLDTNGGTVSVGGALVFELLPADNVIVGGARLEKHRALFEWTWASGTRAGKHEVEFTVQNHDQVS